MRYAVIMAGGLGKRLWPLSRKNRPKQLLPLVGGKSLLELTIDRCKGCFEPENIYVITNAEYAEQVAEAIPSIPRANVIGEPMGRDTANAVALGAEILAARDADATMAVFTADHVIRPVERFQETVLRACEVAEAETDALVTFGIRPTWPHTGLGYIQVAGKPQDGVFTVAAFKEKPEHQTARRYVDSGKYFWNSGMFVWKVSAIRGALEQFLPGNYQKLRLVAEALGRGEAIGPALDQAYPSLERISIDYAVMEKAPKVRMVELSAEWLDVGSWPALEDVSSIDDENNVIAAPNCVLSGTSRSIVVSEGDHLLALLGMEDVIVVHTPDATLVCNKTDAQALKELLDEVEKQHGKRYS